MVPKKETTVEKGHRKGGRLRSQVLQSLEPLKHNHVPRAPLQPVNS